ncbi:M55 family metallopeptidase [Actinospica durhamensis]|uniref:M55 family metallopeptidase n=1 Tax=Actinospica durhamensis TaxID=1508375 RepID=A0A941EVK7_9ACTN|nr:M55 family metallopeptidase [Actinospica durhamensis]MBR7838585.1 M55 family metallopeptidase [Actinospica durhamensis]
MKILISADMEGATGVTWPGDVEPGSAGWERCRELLTGDVNAAVAGLCAGGADTVLVNDAHSTMRNLRIESLDPRATLITGRHKDLSMLEGVEDPRVEGVVMLGYHVGAGADGVLAHTYLPNTITAVYVDGELASEGRLNTLVAAEFGVPVILVTGDDRACEDAARYAPAARTAAVKDHVSRYAAHCRPPAATSALIHEAAREAVALAGRRERPAASGHRVEVEFDAAHLAAATTIIPGVVRVDTRRVAYASESAYAMIRCFKAVTVVASAAVEALYG